MGIAETILDIDGAIRSFPWMDFEVLECSRWKARIAGSLDGSGLPDIHVEFADVAGASMPMEWKSDTSRVVFSEVEPHRARAFNLGFAIEQGYTLFQFAGEDHPEPCVIAARSVALTLTKGR